VSDTRLINRSENRGRPRNFNLRHEAQGDLGNLPSASLGHYASLSFVVRGRGQRSEVGDQRAEDCWSVVPPEADPWCVVKDAWRTAYEARRARQGY